MASVTEQKGHGVLLPNGCRVVHGVGAAVKRPFATLPVVMHELDPGGGPAFAGQFGFIPFREDFRLPRHVHIGTSGPGGARVATERILVVGGVGLVELNGEILLVAPGTLVDIPPGVPHTWTACPSGVGLPDRTRSDGTFLMIYNYADATGFFPTASTVPIAEVAEYRRHEGDLEEIRFPNLSVHQIVSDATFVWNRDIRSDLALA
jgi:hypothetical protein